MIAGSGESLGFAVGEPLDAMELPSIGLLAFIAAILLVAVYVVFSKQRSRSRGNALLLVGPPDAGKTTILSQLVYGQALETHTSLQTNSSLVNLSTPKKSIRVIDVPGHPRIRDQFQEHLNDAKAIAFVVDAGTVSRNGAIVAEHLHSILHTLACRPPSQNTPSLIILAHKYDLLNASSQANMTSDILAVNRVRSVLERELEKRKASQKGGVGVEKLGGEDEQSDMGGLDCNGPPGDPFKFSDWDGGEVSFAGTSAKISRASDNSEKPGGDGLASLREWLDEIA